MHIYKLAKIHEKKNEILKSIPFKSVTSILTICQIVCKYETHTYIGILHQFISRCILVEHHKIDNEASK